MALKQLKKLFLNATDTLTIADVIRSINVIQENIAASLNPLNSKVQNDASIVSGVSLVTGQVNKINHKLGRKLLGYDVMIRGTHPPAITITNDQTNNPSPQLTLWLWTTHNCTVDLNVY